MAALLVVPVGMVFYRAFEKGFDTAWEAVTTPPAQHAFYLTIMITLIAVPLNAVFGVLTAWVLARYEFRGKRFLDVLIDLPFAVSPVVVGLALILVWGKDGWFGSTSVIFSVPGMILATIFVSLPFVVREVLPVLEEEGIDQEQAASTLGARGWQVFWRITLPTIRWGLTYGVILSTARALGEFGAVAVVSGKISGPDRDNDPVRGGPLPVARPHRRVRCRRGAGDDGHLRADADDRDPTTTRKDLNVAIEARGITKRFGDYVALDDVNITVPNGSLTALLGPSGSGKSTLLRVIAGLETPDAGAVLIEGEDVSSHPARTRGVGFVFQHYAAFKHMTVADNVAFGPSVRKRPKAETKARVAELLELVGLAHLGARYPSQLSGGQRQRMALARALAVEPRVLLLDEPFGALDTRVREELRAWLRRLHDEVHVTTIFVTHDQEEAMEIAEQIVVVNEGRIEQSASPSEIYDEPATPFVMSFVGR